MEPIINIPFDEADGSSVAYDYGPGEHHANVHDGRFGPGKFANCIYFPAAGMAEIPGNIEDIVDLAGDFTISFWARAVARGTGPTRTWAVFNFGGSEVVIELFSALAYWQHIAIIQAGERVEVFLDGQKKGAFDRPSAMDGFAIVNNADHRSGGWCSLDSFRVYSSALTEEAVDDDITQNLIPVNFSINNVDFSALGITVETQKGILDLPERKDPLKIDWDDLHGEVIDLVKPVFGPRNIELGCWIKASNQDELLDRWLAVRGVFESAGLQRLQIDLGTRPLIFDVYHPDRLEASARWRESGVLFKRFTLKLREPFPVKRVLRVTGSSCSITLSSPKILRISWGDGTATENIYGEGVTVSHTYAAAGTYYVSVQGNVEDITSFSSDATIIWNRI